MEIINGLEVIKTNNLEKNRLSKWVIIQEKLLGIRMKMLELGQIQRGGALSINQTKNIIITFFSAYYVINGSMTLGEMLAVQYIIGQLNVPIRDIVSFIQNYQDAKLSIERISDIVNDEAVEKKGTDQSYISNELIGDIEFKDVSLRKGNKYILSNINF